MKKKPNPRSAFYNPRLTIICVLCLTGGLIALAGAPHKFSQAQKSPRTSNVAPRPPVDGSVPTTTSPVNIHAPAHRPAPKSPQVVLYDQYDNAGLTAISSQDFEPAFSAKDSELADDFIVPAG